MIDKDVLTGLLVLTPLFLLFGLFVLVLLLRSRRNAAHPPTPEPERGPWRPRLSTGPWHTQLASYFPPYYGRPQMIVVAVLSVAVVAFQMASINAAPSWLYLPPYALASLAVGHAWAFVLDFVRSRMTRASPDDEAQPVAYYTPDMAPASYQPTFRTLSSLIRLVPLAIAALGILFALQLAVDLAPTWPKLNHAADLVGGIGFWLGCREIQRGVTATRS